MQHLIDDLPEQVALIGEDCRILAVNRAWTEAMIRLGYAGVAPGDDYRAICAKNAAEGFEPAVQALAGLDEMLSDKRSFWELIFSKGKVGGAAMNTSSASIALRSAVSFSSR